MKTILLLGLATAILISFSACTTVEEKPAVSHTTTTTEETTVHRPVGTTTETRTIRGY